MGLNFFDRARGGLVGGASRSKAKVAASRKNGKLGGRPSTSTRTLLERILNRPMTQEDYQKFRDAVLSRILLGHQEIITDYFDCHWKEIPQRSWRSLPLPVRQMLRHIKATAKIYLPKTRPKVPKDYVVIRVQKHPAEREHWKRLHPNMPFVETRPRKVSLRDIPGYQYYDLLFSKGQHLSAETIQADGGGQMTKEIAVALEKHLTLKYAK